MNYFEQATTLEEVRQLFKKYARDLHPDNGGSTAEFQEMNRQYHEAHERLQFTHRNAQGETYTSNRQPEQDADMFADMILNLLRLDGLMIELCGTWLWVTGNTKEHKDVLKGMGFHYSSKKCAWYYHEAGYVKRTRSQYSMDDIRNMWGSTSFRRQEEERESIATA